MAITYQKRQKEMKRLEKQREKAERRAQKKIANREQKQAPTDGTPLEGEEGAAGIGEETPDSAQQN
jgi:hypothetical protein